MNIQKHVSFIMLILGFIAMLNEGQTDAAVSAKVQKLIHKANLDGPYVGLVIPNLFELNPLLQHPNFTSSNFTIGFAGKRFRFGTIGEKRVILVLTGLSLINAGITTQLLLTLFNTEGVVHYGTAGNGNPSSLNIADVTIPQYWSHTSLWNWQRYGDGPSDELGLESDGDYTREIGFLNFANYTTSVPACSSYDNLLNNIWYQPEEVFPIDGTPEQRQHIFWVPVDSNYFQISQTLENLKLESCLNSTTCLDKTPKVVNVERGTSASIFLSNVAYRTFIFNRFNISTFDMESAAVALVCFQQRVPFIIIRALSGSGGSGGPNEANVFPSLASNNAVMVVIEFINQLNQPTEAAI